MSKIMICIELPVHANAFFFFFFLSPLITKVENFRLVPGKLSELFSSYVETNPIL